MQRPLCVDLDGTLILTDSLHESLLLLCKKNIFLVVNALFVLLLQGKYALKSYAASKVELDPRFLPYNHSFIEWLKLEKSTGRPLFLVTAAHKKIAQSIACFLGIFDDVFCSTDGVNFKGTSKANFLDKKWGKNEYDYAGDHNADLAVWRHAHDGIIVNASQNVLKKAQAIGKANKVFIKKPLNIRIFLKAVRVHQYVKNLLLFVPLILAQQIFNAPLLLSSLIGFISFSLLASSVYVLNDLLDLSSDRQHHSKSLRAFASGQLSIPTGFLLFILFFILAWVFSSFLPTSFRLVLAMYYILTLGYSLHFKSIVLLDVFFLAGLYTIRIIAGITLLNIGYSEWIIEFSLFLFLSLAFVKRYAELYYKKEKGELKATGRGYHVDNINLVLIIGITSGYIASLVMALYLSSSQALLRYKNPEFLWLVCPLLLYWISRIWLLASEGKMHEDPVVFALKDRASYFVALLIFCSGLLAKFI
jgi:4-hydroxybenzoate polyprenyltransferase